MLTDIEDDALRSLIYVVPLMLVGWTALAIADKRVQARPVQDASLTPYERDARRKRTSSTRPAKIPNPVTLPLASRMKRSDPRPWA